MSGPLVRLHLGSIGSEEMVSSLQLDVHLDQSMTPIGQLIVLSRDISLRNLFKG